MFELDASNLLHKAVSVSVQEYLRKKNGANGSRRLHTYQACGVKDRSLLKTRMMGGQA